MLLWLTLALSSALTNSWFQTVSKWALDRTRYTKLTIAFVTTATAAAVLFVVSFIIGFPAIDARFWGAVAVTGILNAIAYPIILRAYELGEFSSVYSMILLTPVFLLLTSFLLLGEVPSLLGVVGVLLTIAGLWIVAGGEHTHHEVQDYKRGNALGVLAAFLWSVSVNFDKLSALYSDRFFAPASAEAFMAISFACYLLLKERRIIIRKTEVEQGEPATSPSPRIPKMWLLLASGVLLAGSSVLHNSALLVGFASYTIAVKRLGVLFGVVWGWLFFKEQEIGRKLVGALVAVLGVVLIIFA